MDQKTTVHIVPSSHWDREWYLPFRRFQFRLVPLMDKVMALLERGDYPFFLLDGQTVIITDYLEAQPEARPRLEALIAEGKLIVGPWYTVPDFFIPSGETIIRNLTLGIRESKKLGAVHPVGYTPDSFGLPAQLPQILRLCGLRAAFFTRGYVGEKEGFPVDADWVAPDGSALPALHESYARAVFLSYPDIWKNIDRLGVERAEAARQARALLREQSAKYRGGHQLWVVGVDHIMPKDDLPEVISWLNEDISEARFIHSNPADYFAARAADETAPLEFSGEQRGPEMEHFVLGNTLSARADIKQMNRQAEDLLISMAEPLSVYANYQKGSFDSTGLRQIAWRLVLQSHAHDSICGCNADETNRDVETRLRQAAQLALDIRDQHLKEIGRAFRPVSGHPQAATVMVFNPACREQTGLAQGIVRVPFEMPEGNLGVYDAKGCPVQGAKVMRLALKRNDLESMKLSDEVLLGDTTRTARDGHQPYDMFTLLSVSIPARNVPAQGSECFAVLPAPVGQAEAPGAIVAEDHGMENEFFAIGFGEDGSLTLRDKATGRCYEGLHQIEDDADDGDEYTFSPLKGDRPISTKGHVARIVLRERTAAKAVFALEWDLLVPSVLEGRCRRSAETQQVKIISEVGMTAGVRRIEFRTTIANNARDHRMRAVFRFDEAAESALSDTPFDLTERKVYDQEKLPFGAIQTKPMRNVLLLPFSRKGGEDAALLSRSAQEYEVLRRGGKTMAALTLFRAVGAVYHMVTVSKDESNIGPGTRYWCEDAQLQKTMAFEYALELGASALSPSETLAAGHCYSHPLLPVAVEPEGNLPARVAFLTLEPKNLLLSAVAPVPGDPSRFHVRFHHVDEAPVIARLSTFAPIACAMEVDLCGENGQRLAMDDTGAVLCPIARGEIKTVEIRLATTNADG